ncbi:hypothetical protein SSKA14_3198 [Stenotrophomonas sp. SKA14]|nr:hypothetical protein SSKA14_3198 [Stenotrophomonas sp. SKA14]
MLRCGCSGGTKGVRRGAFRTWPLSSPGMARWMRECPPRLAATGAPVRPGHDFRGSGRGRGAGYNRGFHYQGPLHALEPACILHRRQPWAGPGRPCR